MRGTGIFKWVLAALVVASSATAQNFYPSSGGVTVHDQLTGLADNDHTQYCLLAGCTMTAPQLYADGTSAAPSIAFSSNTDAGIFHSSSTVTLQNKDSASNVNRSYLSVGPQLSILQSFDAADAAKGSFIQMVEVGGTTFEVHAGAQTDANDYSEYHLTPIAFDVTFNVGGGGEYSPFSVLLAGSIFRDDTDATKTLTHDLATITAGTNRDVTWPDQAGTVAVLAANGIAVRTAAGAITSRTITGGTGITVTNGDGVSAAPDVAADTSVLVQYTSGTATPSAACSPGEIYHETDIDVLYGCNSTNTWTAALTAASTHTLTNKTFDANGTGNSLSNVDVADLANGTDGQLITWAADQTAATVAVGTVGQVLTSGGVGVAPTFQAAAAADATKQHKFSEKSLVKCQSRTTVSGGGIGWGCDGVASYQSCTTIAFVAATATAPPLVSLKTSASSGNDCYTNAATLALHNSLTQRFSTNLRVVDTADHRVWIGGTSASVTQVAAADPATHAMIFRFDTSASDTNWQCVTNDGSGGGTITDTGTAVDTGLHGFEILTDGGTNVYFYIDGTLECTHTTNLPSAAMEAAVPHSTLTTAVKEIQFNGFTIETDF